MLIDRPVSEVYNILIDEIIKNLNPYIKQM